MSFGVKIKYTVLDSIEPGTITVEELVMNIESMIRTNLEEPVNQI